ncbi:MAG: deoxyhypusine synthase family protein [Planctomycetota bacterium]|jgi:deoxyhypusine synthase
MQHHRKKLLSRVTAKPQLDQDPRDFLLQARDAGFQLGSLGETVDVWKAMLQDPDCVIYLGVAGAVVPAGFGPLLGQIIRANMVDVIYSTGAQVYHDLFEAFRGDHFKLSQNISDSELGRMNIDRIYDVVADDTEYQNFDELIADRIHQFPPSERYTTPTFLEALVESLKGQLQSEEGMCLSALACGVPVFIPTFHDSSTCFALVLLRRREGKSPVNIDYTEDLYQQLRVFEKTKLTGAIFIGGGVPKNHIQQLHPLHQVVEGIYGFQDAGHNYGIQFTADSPVWGGLSGCTMEESESWGKYNKTAPRAVCYGDATINFYLASCAVYAELREALKKRERRNLLSHLDRP